MKVIISEPRKLLGGKAKATITCENFVELATLEDLQGKGVEFDLIERDPEQMIDISSDNQLIIAQIEAYGRLQREAGINEGKGKTQQTLLKEGGQDGK
uniref:Uncharacterized protein n=1 Tax=viral metagenome TaxID=1070528 RepID=A0A6M3L9Z0_9ZZZZ